MARSVVYVAIYTSLRVSELIALKWHDVGTESLTLDERCCRGDWSEPKSNASNATIAVDSHVIERIHRMKLLTVEVRAGSASRKYKVVKSDRPDDLIFQSVKDGKPMRDNNILSRFIKPMAQPADFTSNVDDRVWCEPERCAKPDEARAHSDHARHLRAVCTRVAEKSHCADQRNGI
jgi:integrase